MMIDCPGIVRRFHPFLNMFQILAVVQSSNKDVAKNMESLSQLEIVGQVLIGMPFQCLAGKSVDLFQPTCRFLAITENGEISKR
jgi:hypothetical protein